MSDNIPRRGCLKYEITTSSQRVEAGKEFSISLLITNPFDVPITVDSVTTKLPVELVDVTRERLEKQISLLEDRIKNILKFEIPHLKLEEEKKRNLLLQLIKDIVRIFPTIGISLDAITSATEYIRASNMSSIGLIDQFNRLVDVEDVQEIVKAVHESSDQEKKLKEETLRVLNDKIRLIEDNLRKPVGLNPGSSTVQIFTVRTRKHLFFSPSEYNLHIEIQYTVDDSSYQDVKEHSLSITSSLSSIVFGAMIGSLMGCVVRDIFENGPILNVTKSFDLASAMGYFLMWSANVILSAIAVVIFRRKRDVQSILTIEDFWGGILLGFIVGYGGKSFIEGMLPMTVQ